MDMGRYCPRMEPLLDNVVSEASHILNLSEAVSSGHQPDRQKNQSSFNACLGDKNLGETKSDQHCYPGNCATLLSEIERLRMELSDVQQKHQRILYELHQSVHSTKCGDSNSMLVPQHDWSLGENQIQLHDQVSNGKVLCLNQNPISIGGQIYKQQNNKISPETFGFNNAKDTIQDLNHTVETSLVMEDKSLKMQLLDSEENILDLQSKLRASELKINSMEQKLLYSEQKVQSIQDRLITTNDKAFYLEEALRSSEEVVHGLKTALLESETRASAAKSQLESLQEQNLAHQKTVAKISESLTASEELWRRVPEIEISLQHCKSQVENFQYSLSKAESMHAEEMEQLANKMEKQAMHQQNLQNEVLDLTKKLLHEQVQVREDLVGSVNYDEHVQKPMGDKYALVGDRTQTNSQSNYVDNPNKRRQAGTTTRHNILQNIMQRGKQTPGQDIGERPLQTSLNGLQVEFMELRENLNTVLRDDVEREDKRRWDWMKVLEKSQEWERKAGKLVDSMYWFQNHQMLGNKGGLSDGKVVASHTGGPHTQLCPEVIPHKVCWPQKLDRPTYRPDQTHLPYKMRYSDSMQDPSIQKHHFQRVGFHGNAEGSHRMS